MAKQIHSKVKQTANPTSALLSRESNKPTYKEILEREREKTLLADIAEAIAKIRDIQELLILLVEKIKPIFQFYDTGIFVLGNDGYMTDLSSTYLSIDNSATNNAIHIKNANRFIYAQSAIEWSVEKIKENNNNPLIFKYDEALRKQFPDYTQFEAIYEAGYKESIGTNLYAGNRFVGILFFNSLEEGFFKETKFSLFQSIANNISIAIANILANEEILEREREKDVLLSISKHIAAISSRKELFTIIINEGKGIIPIDDTAIVVLNQDGSM
jgi:formate hydrogenlyase transcriptional activator